MNERTLTARTVFDGKLIKVEVQDIQTDTGVRSVREIVRHPGAATVLAELPDGSFVLVRQYRKPVDMPTLETVAGVLEPGEDPYAAARRELREETGLAAAELVEMGVIYPSPGYTDEKLHVFFAKTDGTTAKPDPDDDERIDIVVKTPEEMKDMIADGEICDGKTLAAWAMWRERRRNAIQSADGNTDIEKTLKARKP